MKKTKSIKKSSKTSAVRVFKCSHCSLTFLRSHELGGHTSRAHKGLSEDYKRKQLRRDEREPERNAHSEAKKFFVEITNQDPSLYRSLVKLIKKDLMKISAASDQTLEKLRKIRAL